MRMNEYRVVTTWRLRAEPWEALALLAEPTTWPAWWPAAFLEVVELERPAGTRIGRRVAVHSKGWLPHSFQLQATITNQPDDEHWVLSVDGDFEGQCVCGLHRVGEEVEVVFDWQPRVVKPFVRYLSWVLKPIFVANHKWVMRRGRVGLDLEVRRRRALRHRLPVPPERPVPPTFPYGPRHTWASMFRTRLQDRYPVIERPSPR